jgi:hypothetical protein
MPIKSVELTEDQAEWLEEHPINFSQLVRKLLTTYMSKHREAYDMSQEEIQEEYLEGDNE